MRFKLPTTLVTVLALAIISGVFYLFFLNGAELTQIKTPSFNSLAEKIEKEILAPEPMVAKEEAPQSFLTQAGVIRLTNVQRKDNGLPALLENKKLDASALAKAQDMLKNQYFEHISPSGAGPSDLAKGVNYEFILIGENLAMGNFGNDQKLIDGWINSPGHRANMLNARFQEIGVAVVKGTFEGKTTWMAVQEFGLPLSSCPQPDLSLKEKINTSNETISDLNQSLVLLKSELEKPRLKRGDSYDRVVDQYNELVNQYNDLIKEVEILVAAYNNQVKTFNACVQ